MTSSDEKFLGFIRYSGHLVEGGLLDARKSAQALLGFDEAVRFFVGRQSDELKEINFDMPVKIHQGSWEALIPDAIFWIKTAVGAGATAYLIKAGQKMADNDFKDIGVKTIIKSSIDAILWVIRIGKHIGTIARRKFERVKFRNDNTEIGILNEAGEILWVPKKYLDLYAKCPRSILKKMADLVENERILSVGVFKDDIEISESISLPYKRIFTIKDEDDMLFPELRHGMEVVLDGEVTRGNETTNSIGFRYQDYILTAHPRTGSVVRYKPALFLNAQIEGTISRVDEFGDTNARKPKIIFTKIIPKENDSKDLSLFEDDYA
jgi:hypothetical protein